MSAATSRQAQGLPETLRDPDAVARVVALVRSVRPKKTRRVAQKSDAA